MTINLWPICTDRGIWSFRPQPGTSPVAVRVPKGSKLLPVAGLGTDLYVPSRWTTFS